MSAAVSPEKDRDRDAAGHVDVDEEEGQGEIESQEIQANTDAEMNARYTYNAIPTERQSTRDITYQVRDNPATDNVEDGDIKVPQNKNIQNNSDGDINRQMATGDLKGGKEKGSAEDLDEDVDQVKGVKLLTKNEINSWYCYDFANSVYASVSIGLVIPLLLSSLATQYACPFVDTGDHASIQATTCIATPAERASESEGEFLSSTSTRCTNTTFPHNGIVLGAGPNMTAFTNGNYLPCRTLPSYHLQYNTSVCTFAQDSCSV